MNSFWEALGEAPFCRPDETSLVARVPHVLSIGKNDSNTNASQKAIKPSLRSAGAFACRNHAGFPFPCWRRR